MGSSSLTRDRIQLPCIASHWTTKKVPFEKKKKRGVNLTQVLSWVHASEHLHMCVPVFFSNGRHLPFQTQPKCHLIPSLSSHNSFKTVQYLSEILELGPLLPTEALGRGLFN